MIFVLLMMIQEGAVAVHNDSSHSLQMLDEGSWKLLLEMFLNSQDICKQALRAIGLDSHEFSAHSLRHSCAVMLMKNGADWKDVQRVLRHSSPVTTQIYTATIEEEIRLDYNPESILNEVF